MGAALALALDVVEGTLEGIVGAREGFEEGLDFFHGGRVAGGGTGRQVGDVRAFLAFGGGDWAPTRERPYRRNEELDWLFGLDPLTLSPPWERRQGCTNRGHG